MVQPERLLAAARRDARLTQAQLAGRLGISQAAIAQLEKPGANPRVGTLDRALRALGAQLVLEARSPGTPWLEFDVIRTDSRGRFHSSYRFRLPGPHDYHFRIVSKYEADFPFAAGASNAVLVEEQ